MGEKMVKKYLWVIEVLFLFIFVSACTTKAVLEKKFLGEKIKYVQTKAFSKSGSGRHFWRHKHLDIDYKYSIDSEAKTITFEGTAKYNLSIDESTYRTETVLLNVTRCEFRLLFTDRDRDVIAVEVFNVYPDTPIFEKVPFKKMLRFDDSYHGLYFAYFLYAFGD